MRGKGTYKEGRGERDRREKIDKQEKWKQRAKKRKYTREHMSRISWSVTQSLPCARQRSPLALKLLVGYIIKSGRKREGE